MSEIFYEIQQEANAAKEKAEKLFERGKYFATKEDYKQAITNYANGLTSYEDYWSKVKALYPWRSDDDEYNAQVWTSRLFKLYVILVEIAKYYGKEGDIAKEAFLKEKSILIVETLGRYQEFFDVGEIESYEKLRELSEISKPLIERQRTAIDLLKASTQKDEQDEGFKTIRIALSRIYLPGFDLDSFKDSCFIATAVYMTSSHPDLDVFRAFRDNILIPNFWGKLAVRSYYQVGPKLASYIEKNPKLRNFIHFQLVKLAKWMREFDL